MHLVLCNLTVLIDNVRGVIKKFCNFDIKNTNKISITLSFFDIVSCNVNAFLPLFTTWAYARAVLGVVILSVCLCLSVRLSHAWIVTNLNGALQIFWYHMKGQSLCYSDTNSGPLLVGDAPFPLQSALKVTHPPPRNDDFDRFPLIMSQL